MAKIINNNIEGSSDKSRSFALLRTNPKLTSNVKLITDEGGDIYLSSIKASRTLAQSEYQKYPISDSGEYCRDIAQFYGRLSKDERYQVGREFTDLGISADYSAQYENLYNYGASFNYTKVYDEQYRIFAPIWLEGNVPEKFVIYRIKDVDFKEQTLEGATGQNSRIQEMLSNATLIKSYDMTNNSKLGRYLNSHVLDPLLPTSHIDFNFELDDPTSFNGIDVMIGGFSEKADYIDDDYIKEDLPEILANNTLTSSFERNGIVSHNIINLEFLFDDNEADDYNIYRYFGIFVDEHFEGSVVVDSVNSLGYLNIDPTNASTDLLDRLPTTYEYTQPILGWVKDINSNYHNILNRFRKTRIAKNQILTSYTGDSSIFVNKNITEFNTPVLSKNSFNGFIELDIINTPSDNDKIFLGDLLEISIENFNLGDFVLIADDTLPIGTYQENRYSSLGNTSQVAAALSAAIRNAEVIPYMASSRKNRVIIDDYSQGRNKNTTVLGINSSNPYTFINMQSSTDANVVFSKKYNDFVNEGGTVSGGLLIGDYDIYTMTGGCSVNQGVLVAANEIGNLEVGYFVKELNKDRYVRIIEIVKDPYSENFRVIFEKPIIFSMDNVLTCYEKYDTPFGKFSAYDFKDFNFDFYDTSNARTDFLDLESMQYKNDESSFGVSSATSVTVFSAGANGYTFDGVNPYILIGGMDATPFIKKGDFVKGIDVVGNVGDVNWIEVMTVQWLEEHNTTKITTREIANTNYTWTSNFNYEDFIFKPGTASDLFKFKSLSSVIRDDVVDRDYIDIEITNEYDRLKENSLKETSLNSRIVPTICKFNLKDSTNSRNLAYILNSNEAFGVNNLSADITKFSERSSEKLNMEHFYIHNVPNYLLQSSSIPLLMDYVYTGDKTQYSDLSLYLKDIGFDYFSTMLNYTGAHSTSIGSIGSWINSTPHVMYTKMQGGDSLNFSSTVFKGLRYVYKDRSEFISETPISFKPSSNVNGFKTATILSYTSNDDVDNAGVNIEVIKNNKFKTISILIDLQIPENDVTEIDRYLLYNLEDITTAGEISDSGIRGFLEFAGLTTFSATGEGVTMEASVQSVGEDAPKFTQDIFKIDEQYSYVLFEHAGDVWAIQVVSVIDDSTIIIKGQPYLWSQDGDGEYFADTNNAHPSPSTIPNNTEITYFNGGKKAWNNTLQDVSSFGLADRINTNRDILYTTILENGEIEYGKFCLEIQSGVEFVKTSILDIEIDDNKPKAFKLNNKEIGYTLVAREDGGYYTTLKRMNGGYNPLFKDIITFSSPYGNYKFIDDNDSLNEEQENKMKKYNRLAGVNCMFNSNLGVDENYGIINNFFFHKVNELGGEVIKLSQESDKLPLYPLIGEIAIDKKDLNLFKSKYSRDYYTRSYGANRSEEVHGTLSPIEERSFFASTIMKVKNEYDITSYNLKTVSSLQALDLIRYDEKEDEGAYLYEDMQKIYIDFYIANSVVKKLKAEKITSYYSKYATAENSYGDKTTLEDDTTIYVEENIIPRFIIDYIKVYGIEKAGYIKSNSLDSLAPYSTLSSVTDIDDITSDGFFELTNFEIRSFAERPLNFRLIYNKKPGYRYNLRVHSKIIA
tara:strand:- start:7639 stop:12429 length:4791 start_codon:yes stop_codon:yes gene_type:complete